MDEATASVDAQTAAVVQAAIQTAFAGCTVLTVAHRLAAVIDSDVLLVLDAGRIVETGPPRTLLADSTTLFSALYAAEQRRVN